MLNPLYADALVGCDNLLAFIMADLDALCGQTGTILYTDVRGLMAVNERYGRETGDFYIAQCARCIRDIALRDVAPGTFGLYRVNGDDFLVILRERLPEDIGQTAQAISNALAAAMAQRGVPGAGIRFVYWTYDSTPASAAELIRKAYELMQQGVADERWLQNLINRMYDYIHDTLTLLEKTSAEALTDSVSQLPNNKAAQQRLSQSQSEYTQQGKPFSVLFIDGDNLRRFNEISYEHGNDMIRRLGRLIQQSTRSTDEVFRWLSGDEFLVVLSDTPKQAAYRMAERVRDVVASTTAAWEYPITVSIGVASYPDDGQTIHDILERAEKSNSLAKKEGKNCVR